MGRTNHRPDLNGLLVLDKPLRATSAGICSMVRKRTRGAKVGHAGTLDPLATGVLLLCLGKATKLVERLMTGAKGYHATVDLAHTSVTDDLESIPDPAGVEQPPTSAAIETVLRERFTGEIQQAPPAHSAVHVEGKRAYELARAGRAVDMPTKTVVVHAIEVVSYAYPELVLHMRTGRGFYVRSLARDLGEALGTGGMLTTLRRTQVGPFTLDDARTPDAIGDEITADHLIPIVDVERRLAQGLSD
ncbi:MAG: tRNA pseudouridine(55) synthase TruB [Phycisphaerales bacterium]